MLLITVAPPYIAAAATCRSALHTPTSIRSGAVMRQSRFSLQLCVVIVLPAMPAAPAGKAPTAVWPKRLPVANAPIARVAAAVLVAATLVATVALMAMVAVKTVAMPAATPAATPIEATVVIVAQLLDHLAASYSHGRIGHLQRGCRSQ